MLSSKSARPGLSEQTKIAVWAAAAGRCTLCNELVLENEHLGAIVPIGELAHVVGWSGSSPRGIAELDDGQRRSADNLLLLCRNCHKPIDDGGYQGLYSVEELITRKREHEARIRQLTAIGADRKATVLRVVGAIRGVVPELSYDTALTAVTRAGLLPQLLPGSFRNEFDVDLRTVAGEGTAGYFQRCAVQLDERMSQLNDGIRRDQVARLAVFGFARVPILVYLGAGLDDKVPAVLFQRHRVDPDNPWCWPDDPPPASEFDVTPVTSATATDNVALVINLSGTIDLSELPSTVRDTHAVYVLAPAAPISPSPALISSLASLSKFEQAVRRFLARVEADHGKIARIALFPAIPLTAATTLGRVLMPHVSPAWTVFDRNEQGQFFEALEVRR